MSALKRQRVSQEEINKSVRESGFTGFDKIEAIIIESTGDITVISKSEKSTSDAAMDDIKNF